MSTGPAPWPGADWTARLMFRSKILLLALALLGSFLVIPPSAHAASRSFYVSPSGRDAADGSIAHPWRSVAHGMSALRAGDTLFLRGGVYDERVTGRGGSYLRVEPANAVNRTLVRAYPGERPVIRGVFWVTGMDFWTFDNVDVTWAAGNDTGEHMVRFKNGRGWVLERSEIWGARGYANINVTSDVPGEPAGWSITRNCIHDNYGDPSHGTAKDQLLYVNTGLGAGQGVIGRNLVFGAPRGKGIKLAGPDASSGSTDVTVRYNTVFDTYKPGITVGRGTTDSKIYRNLVVRTQDKALIRGFRLDGSGNAAWDNGWAEGPRGLVSDNGFGSAIADQGGQTHVVPAFDSTTCGAFHPGTATAARFGRWAR